MPKYHPLQKSSKYFGLLVKNKQIGGHPPSWTLKSIIKELKLKEKQLQLNLVQM